MIWTKRTLSGDAHRDGGPADLNTRQRAERVGGYRQRGYNERVEVRQIWQRVIRQESGKHYSVILSCRGDAKPWRWPCGQKDAALENGGV